MNHNALLNALCNPQVPGPVFTLGYFGKAKVPNIHFNIIFQGPAAPQRPLETTGPSGLDGRRLPGVPATPFGILPLDGKPVHAGAQL